jgi:hypothetical protein
MSIPERKPTQELFKTLLLTVVGQAYQAAGYEFEYAPIQWVGGKYRFVKSLDNDFKAYIEYQVLAYTDTGYSSGQPSRFRVNLIRSDKVGGKLSTHPRYAQRTLSALVVDDFGVEILPSADYWWTFTDGYTLGQVLAEAGHLAVGYGIPWLSETLQPPDTQSE